MLSLLSHKPSKVTTLNPLFKEQQQSQKKLCCCSTTFQTINHFKRKLPTHFFDLLLYKGAVLLRRVGLVFIGCSLLSVCSIPDAFEADCGFVD